MNTIMCAHYFSHQPAPSAYKSSSPDSRPASLLLTFPTTNPSIFKAVSTAKRNVTRPLLPMANPCAGLDPTWAHLPAGHCHSTSSWLFPAAAAFENEALTCALRASMSPAAASSSPYPATPSSSSTSSASELLSGGHDAPPPASKLGQPARPAPTRPKAGRVTKRKQRPTRRPPPTYIVADPANFRRMVQEVTGFPVASTGVRQRAATTSIACDEPASNAAPSWPTPPQPACLLPTLDTSAFLFDHRAAATTPDDKSSSGDANASPSTAVTAVEPATATVKDDDSSVLQELEEMACAAPGFVSDFLTLENWGVI